MATSDVIETPWLTLKNTIQKMLLDNKPFTNCSQSNLFHNKFNIVIDLQNDKTIDELKDLITEHLEKNVRAMVVNISSYTLFFKLCNIWDDFQSSMDIIIPILVNLNRDADANDSHQKIIRKMSNELFSNLIVYHGSILDTIRMQLFQMLNDDRDGKTVDHENIKKLLTIMLSLESVLDDVTTTNVYQLEFKPTILKEFSTFIDAKGKELVKTSANVRAYINSAESIIAQEEDRLKNYFDEKTIIELESIMYNNLVQLHMNAILETKENDIRYMIENKEYEHLAHMYNFLNLVGNGFNPMVKYLYSYVFELGKIILLDTNKNTIDFIQGLLDLDSTCNYILVNCFKTDFRVKLSFNECLKKLLAMNPIFDKYLLAYVVDKLKTIVETTSQEHEVVLEALKFYDYLQDIEYFENSLEHFMATMLFNRFLKSSVPNNTAMHLLSLLKDKCSRRFTSRVFSMINDVDTYSKTALDEFKQHVEQSKTHLFTSVDDFNVLVLSKAYWPIFKNITCNLPLELTTIFDNFKKFYKTKNNRCLILLPKYGLMDLKAVFYGSPQSKDKSLASVSPKEYTIQGSTFQTCVLLLFNKCDQLSLETIMKETNIPEHYLIPVIQSLILNTSSQCNILTKNPQCDKIELTDKFFINEAFTSESNLVKIHFQKTKLNSVVEKEINNENMLQNRDMSIKLSIVQIMKLKKEMTHAELIEEVEKVNSKFKPTIAIIKEQINKLMEREYIVRSAKDPNVYIYIA